MIADCPACARDGADVRAPRKARGRLKWLALLPAILYALAPKCPMCVVAYLSAFGVTFGVASLALSFLGPLAVASVALALGFALRARKLPRFRVELDAILARVGHRPRADPARRTGSEDYPCCSGTAILQEGRGYAAHRAPAARSTVRS